MVQQQTAQSMPNADNLSDDKRSSIKLHTQNKIYQNTTITIHNVQHTTQATTQQSTTQTTIQPKNKTTKIIHILQILCNLQQPTTITKGTTQNKFQKTNKCPHTTKPGPTYNPTKYV